MAGIVVPGLVFIDLISYLVVIAGHPHCFRIIGFGKPQVFETVVQLKTIG
jgi:hypothetical protein